MVIQVSPATWGANAMHGVGVICLPTSRLWAPCRTTTCYESCTLSGDSAANRNSESHMDTWSCPHTPYV